MDFYIIIGRYWFADTKEDYRNFGFTTDKSEIEKMANHVFEMDSEIDWVGYQHWRNKTTLVEQVVLKDKSKS